MDFRNPVTKDVIDCLSLEAQQCIRRLAAHQPDVAVDVGKTRAAAVFIGLFERPGLRGLQVILTTRAKTLRYRTIVSSHPNQTRREAFEEVGLPMGYHRDLHYVTQLQPFLSKYKIIVFPVVYLMSSMDLVNSLTASPDEVGAIWSLPLEYCLTAQWKEEYGVLSEKGGADWPYSDEYYLHVEQLGHNVVEDVGVPNEPIPDDTNASGLTCDITLTVAEIAFGRSTVVDRYAKGQMPFFDAVLMAIEEERSLTEDLRNRPELRITRAGDNHDGLLSLPVTPSVEVAPYRPTAAL
ncbi:hypothetical protein QFC21_000100 [Naganishia friedmannii]|uniref:Uncharacterized protein n=1 Tax=Naganishia friedmannii TaxID=89922 RepID=A0ACC2WCC1_9TREE|nr:hypothetical protein QFC21_000100 [Naganishia friedmannii]